MADGIAQRLERCLHNLILRNIRRIRHRFPWDENIRGIRQFRAHYAMPILKLKFHAFVSFSLSGCNAGWPGLSFTVVISTC